MDEALKVLGVVALSWWLLPPLILVGALGTIGALMGVLVLVEWADKRLRAIGAKARKILKRDTQEPTP